MHMVSSYTRPSAVSRITANAERYFEAALGTPHILPLGIILWIATITAAGFCVGQSSGAVQGWYVSVLVTTIVTGVTTAADFSGKKWITPVTVILGSFALLVSQSLWSEDREDAARAALFILQVIAVGIQLAAIANSSGRDRISEGMLSG